jgi:hypothetical protein
MHLTVCIFPPKCVMPGTLKVTQGSDQRLNLFFFAYLLKTSRCLAGELVSPQLEGYTWRWHELLSLAGKLVGVRHERKSYSHLEEIGKYEPQARRWPL